MGTTRKTVLFIVEGSSDKTALEKIFRSIYKNNKNIEFKFTDGDISSDETTTKENVEDRIYQIVYEFMKDKKLNKNDIYQIVQLFDTDGVYIPEKAIVFGGDYAITYSTTSIICRDIKKVVNRNNLKTAIMDYLLGIQTIKDIPYSMYFMSCNLDHALYDEINLDKDLKQAYADAFYEKFIGKEQMFIEFLKTDVVNGVPDAFNGSWRYIKEDLHSLERHTNLHIYFAQNPLPDGLY
ncbi:MAG: hypothetical protein HDR17_06465 [Lachnospiraceae bacterium]|nr:hypothetical protein [Lachnospiraceae bacterium]